MGNVVVLLLYRVVLGAVLRDVSSSVGVFSTGPAEIGTFLTLSCAGCATGLEESAEVVAAVLSCDVGDSATLAFAGRGTSCCRDAAGLRYREGVLLIWFFSCRLRSNFGGTSGIGGAFSSSRAAARLTERYRENLAFCADNGVVVPASMLTHDGQLDCSEEAHRVPPWVTSLFCFVRAESVEGLLTRTVHNHASGIDQFSQETPPVCEPLRQVQDVSQRV